MALAKIAGVPQTFAGDESSIKSTRSPVSITQEEQSIAARNIPGVGEQTKPALCARHHQESTACHRRDKSSDRK